MKEYVCLLAGVVLLTACGKKETNVTNPPAENATEAASSANAPVTNLPVEKKTETKTTTVDQSATPETNIPAVSASPTVSESPASSSDTNTTPASGGTTETNSSFIGGSSSSSSSAEPGATVNPAREALRRQIQQGGGALPSPTP
jgi:hypothetical protein